MDLVTIYWENKAVHLIDQTLLPSEEKVISITDYTDLAEAIKKLKVRGAPAIGVAGAFGMALASTYSKKTDKTDFLKEMAEAGDIIAATRPTAVNLFWALKKISDVIMENKDREIVEIKRLILEKALQIWKDDIDICNSIGKNASVLFRSGDRILTHCNAGSLATVKYGTALAGVYYAFNEGKSIEVYADETRPLLQGARLTSWELNKSGIPVTVLCDNMSASLISRGKINKIIVGADRIAANGDTANKIGTFGLAIIARYHNIPFYVAAPLSTFDFELTDGSKIPIEQRSSEELSYFNKKRIIPEGVRIYNPAFDVTPSNLISAWISEKGIAEKAEKFKEWL
ncbi:MAG: S-methyl-5-thioribose-1-phosphate isomerase [Candidatus Coatesbacteria bacterium]|nr:S-methyl-5-thioribose-1-phosphate isomerase [Candidatus Coatesbacteria bacterium]